MKHATLKTVHTLCLVPLVALCMATAAQAQTVQPASPTVSMPKGHMQKNAGGSDGMKHSMMTGMDSMQKMPMSGDVDKDFAMMMKMHHQQGVEMAQLELVQGKSPAMKAMAKKIISAQKKEIVELEQWLAKQK